VIGKADILPFYTLMNVIEFIVAGIQFLYLCRDLVDFAV